MKPPKRLIGIGVHHRLQDSMKRNDNASNKDAFVALVAGIETTEGSCIRNINFYARTLGLNRKDVSELIQELANEKRITLKTQWVDGVKRIRINTRKGDLA